MFDSKGEVVMVGSQTFGRLCSPFLSLLVSLSLSLSVSISLSLSHSPSLTTLFFNLRPARHKTLNFKPVILFRCASFSFNAFGALVHSFFESFVEADATCRLAGGPSSR